MVLESGSLDVAAARAANPALVAVSVTGFGLTGPRAGWLAPDLVVQAMGGLMYISGEAAAAPVSGPDALGFGFGSVVAALGCVLALAPSVSSPGAATTSTCRSRRRLQRRST